MNEFLRTLKNIRKKLKESGKEKAVYFFGFYTIFFIILFIMIASSSKTPIKHQEKSNLNTDKYSLSLIEDNNYHFNYQIKVNMDNYSYIGDKNKEKEKFEFTQNNITKNFLKEGNVYKEKENTTYKFSDNPYILDKFLNIYNLKEMINSSTYKSKTIYESNREVYHYEITTSTIKRIIDNQEADISDIPNEIDVSVEDGNVNQINLNLNSFINYENNNYINCSIKLGYSNFSKIKEITE